MAESSKDAGVIQALLVRFETQRLPRGLALKKKVDGGQLLGDSDLAFLERVLEDSRQIKALADKYPQWQPLYARAAALYKDITEKALENETASGTSRS